MSDPVIVAALVLFGFGMGCWWTHVCYCAGYDARRREESDADE